MEAATGMGTAEVATTVSLVEPVEAAAQLEVDMEVIKVTSSLDLTIF